MKFNQASSGIRLFFVIAAVIVLIGIGLTGFANVHWFLYAMPAFFLFAAITGICPGLIVTRKIMGDKAN